jgi:hypothetical protein
LSAEILSKTVKQRYQQGYQKLLDQLCDVSVDGDYNASDPHNYRQAIKEQAKMCLSVLKTPTPVDSEQRLEALVRHCERWDGVYGYDARTLYPEFGEILDRYDYNISS